MYHFLSIANVTLFIPRKVNIKVGAAEPILCENVRIFQNIFFS